jgi:hypothetical protein
MQFAGFRHKGLRHLYEGGAAKGVPPTMADKLRKLLLALETGVWFSGMTKRRTPPATST